MNDEQTIFKVLRIPDRLTQDVFENGFDPYKSEAVELLYVKVGEFQSPPYSGVPIYEQKI